jgi:proteasome lid subunit RPN8/RPN11
MDWAPEEACGILIGGPETGGTRVMQLTNASDDPENSFVIEGEDITRAIERWCDEELCTLPEGVVPKDFKIDIVVWHTHPDGFVGPSKGDLRVREEGVKYLVVALPGGTAVRF